MRKRFAAPRLVLVLGFVSLVLGGVAQAAEQLTQVAENVFAFADTRQSSKDNSFGANAGIIVGRDGILVVDTLVSAKEAQRLLKAIRAVSDKPIRYVVNTHYHLDHAFGNGEFAKLGALVIAQESGAQAMRKTAEETLKSIGEFGLTTQDMQGTTIAYPVLGYGDRMTIDLGDQIVELRHARTSHTDGDTVVYLADKKVLFAGDILFTGYHPFLAEGNIETWCAQLDDLQAMDVEKIIPGHGPVSSKKDLAEMKQYLLAFDREAKALAAKGVADAEAATTELLKVLPPRPEGAWLVTANLQMKYLKK